MAILIVSIDCINPFSYFNFIGTDGIIHFVPVYMFQLLGRSVFGDGLVPYTTTTFIPSSTCRFLHGVFHWTQDRKDENVTLFLEGF